jgi:hypothetical protein
VNFRADSRSKAALFIIVRNPNVSLVDLDPFWSNSAINSPVIYIQGSSAICSTAECSLSGVPGAANDPEEL